MDSPNYYEILGVGRFASSEQIKKATHRLVEELHPAFKDGNPVAIESLKEIRAAYEVLSDPTRKAEYDLSLGEAQGGEADSGGIGWRVVEPPKTETLSQRMQPIGAVTEPTYTPQPPIPAKGERGDRGGRTTSERGGDTSRREEPRRRHLEGEDRGWRVVENERSQQPALPEHFRATEAPRKKGRKSKSGVKPPWYSRLGTFLTETALLLLGSVVVAVLIKTFLVQPFYVDGPSMLPTLEDNDRVMISKIAYLMGDPVAGDVVVIVNPDMTKRREDPFEWAIRHVKEAFGVPTGDQPDFIKRVIAVAGDEIEIRASTVYVNGEALEEPYINPNGAMSDMEALVVPPEHVWVMGDNRGVSRDSRQFGAVHESEIVGKAIIRIWPLGRFGGIPH